MYDAPKLVEKKPFLHTRRLAIGFCTTIVAIAVLCAILAPFIFLTANIFIPDCTLNTIFGLRCPLCGGTRCMRAIVQLDFATAVYYNPLVVVTVLLLLYAFVRVIISCFSREYKPYKMKTGKWTPWVVLAIYISFEIVRNLPFYRAILY